MRKVFYDRYAEARSSGLAAWPKKGQKLLKEPKKTTPREVSADLDWLRYFNNDLAMPEGYKDSADFLIEALLSGGDGTHPDRFSFPILYLYRHAVELKLKEIIQVGIQLDLESRSDKLDEKLCEHALLPLWFHARQILEKYWGCRDTKELAVAASERMIDELHQTDRDGQSLRYSHTKEGTQFKHKLPDQVDLLNLRTMFDCLWNLLSANAELLGEELENRNSYRP